MPTGGVKNEGKSQFVKDVLKKDPFANARVVNEEWAKAGHDSEISSTLVNKLRSSEGYSGNLRSGRKPGAKSKTTKVIVLGKRSGRKPKSSYAPVASVRADAHTATRGSAPRAADLDQVEADLDRLLFKVMGLEGLSGVENELRQARRMLWAAFNK